MMRSIALVLVCFGLSFSLGANPILNEIFRVPLDTLSLAVEAVAWHTIGDNELLAVTGSFIGLGGDERLRLYKYGLDEYGDKALFEVDKLSTASLEGTGPLSALDWQEVPGTALLALGGDFFDNGTSGDEKLRLYELLPDGYGGVECILGELFKVPTTVLDGPVHAVSWVETPAGIFLAVGGMFSGVGGSEKLRLYELDGGMPLPTLVEIYKESTSTIDGDVRALSWKEDGGVFYLAVGGSFSGAGGTESLRLYVLDEAYPGPPILIEIDKVDSSVFAGPVLSVDWKSVNGRCLLAVAGDPTFMVPGGDDVLRVYELVPGPYGTPVLAEISKVSASTLSGIGTTVEWKSYKGECFIGVGGIFPDPFLMTGGDEDVRLYRFDPATDLISEEYKVSTDVLSGDVLTLGWHFVDGCCLLAVGGSFMDEYGNPDSIEDLRLFSLNFLLADIALTKSVTNDPALAGSINTYKITVINNGVDIAPNVRITDVLPAGVSFVSSIATTGSYSSVTGEWVVGNLAVGSTEMLYITVMVDAGLTPGSTVTNTAIFGDPYDIDPYLDNDSDSVTFTVGTPAICDLSVVKVSDKTEVDEGDNVAFTITVNANQVN